MEEKLQIALKLKELEVCGELRVVYMKGMGANAVAMANADKFVIVIDPNLSYEQQVKEIWHEAKHIYSHLNNENISIENAEYEADSFAKKAVSNNLMQELKKVDNL